MQTSDPAQRLETVVLLLVLALMLPFGLFRLDPIDIPEHLMVGRLIWQTGSPLTSNLLSWTFPDYPVDQQYPLYQVVIYLMQVHLGWWSLSVFCCASWALAVLAWMGFGGTRRQCAGATGVWLLGVVGVQRHLVARPEVFSLLGMGLLLILWERWRREGARWPLVAMVAVQWVMVNTHQLWVLGMILQVGFVLHLLCTRALAGRGWVDDADAALPVSPMALTLLASALALTLSPYGFRVFLAPLALFTTVRDLGVSAEGGPQSAELAPIWTEPLGGPVALILLLLVVYQGYRARWRWQLYELGTLGLCLAMVLVALRGIPFFALAAASVITRWSSRSVDEPLLPADSLVHAARTLTTGLLASMLLVQFLKPQPYVYLRRQQGLGKSVGEWGEDTTRFLRTHPPPGEMLNIGWVAANYLNFDVYPVKKVFVDGRWEAYPKPFLNDCMAMIVDQATLDKMIATWDPGFVLAEMRMPAQQQRIAELVRRGEAVLVHVDSIAAIAVRKKPGSEAYLAEFGVVPSEVEPTDWLPEHPILYAQQQVRVARLLHYLGEDARAETLLTQARQHQDHVVVRADLATVGP